MFSSLFSLSIPHIFPQIPFFPLTALLTLHTLPRWLSSFSWFPLSLSNAHDPDVYVLALFKSLSIRWPFPSAYWLPLSSYLWGTQNWPEDQLDGIHLIILLSLLYSVLDVAQKATLFYISIRTSLSKEDAWKLPLTSFIMSSSSVSI